MPQVAQAKIDGLQQHYDITDGRTLGFFQTHASLDIEHSNAERALIEEFGAGHEDEVLAVDGAKRSTPGGGSWTPSTRRSSDYSGNA